MLDSKTIFIRPVGHKPKCAPFLYSHPSTYPGGYLKPWLTTVTFSFKFPFSFWHSTGGLSQLQFFKFFNYDPWEKIYFASPSSFTKQQWFLPCAKYSGIFHVLFFFSFKDRSWPSESISWHTNGSRLVVQKHLSHWYIIINIHDIELIMKHLQNISCFSCLPCHYL
jgi:hypothetical protein